MIFELCEVHSEHGQLQPHGPRNGPARLRRREKRAAARADAENASAEVIEAKDVELAEKAEEVLADTIGSAAGEAAGLNLASKANEFDEKPAEKAETLEDLKDEVCPDDIYRFPNDSNVLSVGTQTLECGVANSHPSKSTLDFYTLTYDDRNMTVFHFVSISLVHKPCVFCCFLDTNKDLKQKEKY